MKITVDRNNTDQGNLIFTISVTDPHHSCFGEIENQMMYILDTCKEQVYRTTSEENKTKNDIMALIHAAKEKTFMRVLDNLKFSIENEFRPMFKPICQEIYNWIQDQQTEVLKKWIMEFDPQRTKYYFSNDEKMQRELNKPEESPVDKFEEDNEDE